jgi:proteic killer suppression protein
MIKSFRHKGLQRYYETGNKSGILAIHATKLRLILGRLDASQTPQDMNLPGLRLHQLTGNFAGFYAVDVSGNWRVLFRLDGYDIYDVDYLDYH